VRGRGGRRPKLRQGGEVVSEGGGTGVCLASNLGYMYDSGEGVPQDYTKAHMWYNLAASKLTDKDRAVAVDNRDLVAEKMTPAQIAEAQRLAREWRAKPSE